MNDRILSRIQRVSLIFIFVMVPLVYSSKSYYFIQIKEILFSAGAAMLALSFFLREKVKIKKLSIVSMILPAWFIVSLLAGDYKYAGLPVLCVAAGLTVLFLFAANTAWNLKSTRAIIVISSVPVVVLGLVQVFIPEVMKEFMVFGNRVASTLGNPNFFGAYLAGIAPLALGGVMAEKGQKRILYAFFLLAAVFCMIATGSKAALIGFIFIVSWPCFIFIKKRQEVKKNIVILACLIAAVLMASVAVMGRRMSGNNDRAQWAKNESVFFRAYTWLGTTGIIMDHIVTGTGPGSFAAVYPEYRRSEIMLWTHEHSYETTQPENILLQIAAETGLIGLLIFFIFVFLVVKNAKEEHNGFLTGILAVLIINLAGVDINYITSSMLIVFYSGIIISGDERGKSFEIKGWKKPACLAAVLLCFACIAVLQLNRYFSNISLKQGIFYSQSKQWPEAMNSYLNAIDKDRHNLPAGYFLANSYFDSGISAKKALAEYLLIEKLAPNYVLLHYNKARIFNWTGNYKEALNEYNKMLKIDPYFKPALVELAQLYFEREKMYPEAENCLKKGLEAYPGDASLYNNLGNIYFMTNRSAEALEAFKKAVDLKADKDYYYNLGCVYFTLEDTENADLYLEKALETGREDSRIIEMLKRVRKYKVQKEGR